MCDCPFKTPVQVGLEILEMDPELRALLTPVQSHEGDSGWDLKCRTSGEISPGTTIVIPTGIRLKLPPHFEVQVRPRSGLSKKRIAVAFGTVDNGYRGEVGVIVSNHSSEPWMYAVGDRLGQMVFSLVPKVSLKLTVVSTDDTTRSASGFGSTGVK